MLAKKLKPFLQAGCLMSLALVLPSARAQEKEAATPKFTITTGVFPTGAGTVTGGGTVASNKTFILTAHPDTAAGYGFFYWSTNGIDVGSSVTYTNIATTNETLVANFGWLVTTVSDPPGGGTTSGGGVFFPAFSVTVTAVPYDCYAFVAWTKGNGARVVSTNPSYTFTVSSGEALTAVFEKIKYVNTTVSSPAIGGKVTGGGTVFCGTKVTLTATPAAGFKFTGWSVGGSLVGTNTSTTYKFTTESNQTYTAYFSDVEDPTITISSYSVAGSLLTVTGTAKDNTDVGCVFYALNGNPASAAGLVATTTNGYTNWSATAILPPGKNVFYALAVDSSPNLNQSKIVSNTIPSVSSNQAPISLAGLVAQLTEEAPPGTTPPNMDGVKPVQTAPVKKLDGQSVPSQISFGTATFAQFSSDNITNPGAGNYTYEQTGPNTAELVFNYFAPPYPSGDSDVFDLTFTDPSTATYYGGPYFGSFGSITLSPGLTSTLTSAEGRNSTSVDASSGTTYNTDFGDGTFTTVSSLGTNTAGSYTFTQVGPGAALLVEIFPDPSLSDAGGYITNYIVDQFTSIGLAGDGNYFATDFSSSGGGPYYSSGTFTSTNRPAKTVYVAPASLNGATARVTVQNSNTTTQVTVTFGEATLGFSTTDTNDTSGVADYTYTRTGLNSASVVINYIAPPQATNNNGSSIVVFQNSTHATFQNLNGTHGSIVLSAPAATAPATLSGKTITLTETSPSPKTEILTLGTGGIFSSDSSNGEMDSGTYTFAQYSPEVVMLTRTDAAGDVIYAQLTFSSAKAGTFFATSFNPGSTAKTKVGHFTTD
jgi:hypothetical protein